MVVMLDNALREREIERKRAGENERETEEEDIGI